MKCNVHCLRRLNLLYLPESQVDVAKNFLLRLNANHPVDLAAIFEKEDHRDALDAEPAGGLRIFVDVEFGHSDATGELPRQLINCGGEHVTRSTPVRPEVEKNRLRVPIDPF